MNARIPCEKSSLASDDLLPAEPNQRLPSADQAIHAGRAACGTGHRESFKAMHDATAARRSSLARPSDLNAALANVARSPATARDPRRSPPGTCRRRAVRRERNGIVLVFVVVLLTLLGIMGTAYLASSRLDRQAIVGRGALPDQATPLMRDASTLDAIARGMERSAKVEIVRDLFNISPSIDYSTDGNALWGLLARNGSFRASLSTPARAGAPYDPTTSMIPWYEDYDAPGRADAWLSSLLPARGGASSPAGYPFCWTWIGGPLTPSASAGTTVEPFFSDPRFITTGVNASNGAYPRNFFPDSGQAGRWALFDPKRQSPGSNVNLDGGTPASSDTMAVDENSSVNQRHNVPIASVSMLRSDYTAANTNRVTDGTRVYPGLIPPTLAGNPGGLIVIAGDADGDGIADGGLMPIVLNPAAATTSIDRYLDRANGVIYMASYRIVDNGAKLNLATALDDTGDVLALQTVGAAGQPENIDSNSSSTAKLTGAPTELREFLAEDPAAPAPVDAPTVGYTYPTPPTTYGILGPNYGFFRSNVGLISLIRAFTAPMNQYADPTDNYRVPFQKEVRSLLDARFPLLKQNPGGLLVQDYAGDDFDVGKLSTAFTYAVVTQNKMGLTSSLTPATLNAPADVYRYRSFGDLLEQQVARRPGNPGGYLWANSPSTTGNANQPTFATDAFRWFGAKDAESLAAKDGALVDGSISPGAAETALPFTLRLSAANVNNDGQEPWPWFPANQWDLWFGWTQDFGPDVANVPSGTVPTIDVLDALAGTPQLRAFNYSATGNAANVLNKPAGTADTYLLRSPRAIVTTYNGVTATVPERRDYPVANTVVPAANTLGLPIGMPAYRGVEARDNQTGIGHAKPIANVAGTPTSAVGQDPINGSAYFAYPPVKVSAATGTKEQLWRAFWSSMTEQHLSTYVVGTTELVTSFWDAARKKVFVAGSGDLVPPAGYDPDLYYDAFRSSDRYASNEYTYSDTAPSSRTYLGTIAPAPAGTYDEQHQPTETLTSRQMALLRSAVAACNTIDLRDNDNDITAMDVDLTDNNNVIASVGTPRYYARVYGTEKQLVISGVYMENGGANPFVCVEIYNPTDVPIQLNGYRLAVVNRTGVAPFKTTGTLTVTAGNDPIRLSTNVNTPDYLYPGGFVIVASRDAAPDPLTFAIPTSSQTYTNGGPPQVFVQTPTIGVNGSVVDPTLQATLESLMLGARTQELVLYRTRRADGVQFRDGVAANDVTRNAIENEVANVDNGRADSGTLNQPGYTDVRTLVPLDAVDCRLQVGGLGAVQRYLYERQLPAAPPMDDKRTTPPPPANVGAFGANYSVARPNAWRCFYAGKFYDQRRPPHCRRA